MEILRSHFLLLSFASFAVGAILAPLMRPTYLLDWPLQQREDAQLFVGGAAVPLSDENPLRIRSNWFSDTLLLKRAGFRDVRIDLRDSNLSLSKTPYRPQWNPTDTRQLRDRLDQVVQAVTAKLRSPPAAVDSAEGYFASQRRQLLAVAAELKPARDPEHAQLATSLGELLRGLPHPLEYCTLASTVDVEPRAPVWTLGSKTLRHSRPVLSIAISPDGRLVASGSGDAGILIHDTSSGQQLMTLDGHEDGVTSLAFHPSSSTLFSTGYDGRLLTWDLTSRSPRLLDGSTGSVHNVVVSPDGNMLAFDAFGRNVQLWMIEEGKARWKYVTASRVRQLQFFANSDQLAILHERALDIVDLATGELTAQIDNTNNAEHLTYSPAKDEVHLIGSDSSIIWSLRQAKQTFRYPSKPDTIAVAPDRSWIAEFQRRKPENRVRLNWNQENYFLPIGQRVGTRFALEPERKIAVVGTVGGGVFIHHLDPPRLLAPVAPQQSWRHAAFDSSGENLILVTTDGTLAVLDCMTRRLKYAVDGSGAPPQQLLVSPKTNDLWIEDGNGLRSIALDAPDQRQQINGARSAAMSRDGNLLAFVTGPGTKPELSVHDLRTSRESLRIDLPADLSQLTFGEGQTILFGLDASQRPMVIDLEQRVATTLDLPQQSQVQTFAAIRWIGGRLLLASGSDVYAFDMTNGTMEEQTFRSDVTSIIGSGWSNRWLAVTAGTIFHVNGSVKVGIRIGSNAHRYSSVALSPCTRYIAIALGNGQVELHGL